MATRQVFRGLILDDDMEHGFIRVIGAVTPVRYMTEETWLHLQNLGVMPLVASMIEVEGPGVHQLPEDLRP